MAPVMFAGELPPSRGCAAAVLLMLLGGCGRGFNEDALVDCRTLVPVPADRMAEDFGPEFLMDGLGRGEARVALLWKTRRRTVAYLSSPAPGYALTNLFGGWAVQSELFCFPHASVALHLEAPTDGPRPLTEGAYPVSSVGFDVPDYEQGSNPDTRVVDGEITVDSVGDQAVTGSFDGRASVDLESYFGARPLGISIEVLAMAFHELPLLDDYPPNE